MQGGIFEAPPTHQGRRWWRNISVLVPLPVLPLSSGQRGAVEVALDLEHSKACYRWPAAGPGTRSRRQSRRADRQPSAGAGSGSSWLPRGRHWRSSLSAVGVVTLVDAILFTEVHSGYRLAPDFAVWEKWPMELTSRWQGTRLSWRGHHPLRWEPRRPQSRRHATQAISARTRAPDDAADRH